MNPSEPTDAQRRYWDKESAEPETYCRRFLDAVEQNRWLEMLQTVERRLDLAFHGEILELGGGSQFLSRWLANRGNVRVLCTDLSEKRLADFTQFYGGLPANMITQGNVNAGALGFPDGQFNFIFGDAMLHHIENLRAALFEIRRCLKPAGLAVFIR